MPAFATIRVSVQEDGRVYLWLNGLDIPMRIVVEKHGEGGERKVFMHDRPEPSPVYTIELGKAVGFDRNHWPLHIPSGSTFHPAAFPINPPTQQG